MSSFVHTSIRQFAVISVRTLPHCERLVIDYPDERTLRDLLAQPSIVALGYSSREEAEASLCRCRTTAQPLWRKSMATAVADRTQALKEFVCNHPTAKNRFSLWRTQTAICGLLQQTFAAVVVLIYSKNVLSAALRAFISF